MVLHPSEYSLTAAVLQVRLVLKMTNAQRHMTTTAVSRQTVTLHQNTASSLISQCSCSRMQGNPAKKVEPCSTFANKCARARNWQMTLYCGWCNLTVYITIMETEDKMTITMMTFQSCKILSHRIITHCAAFWHLTRLQTQEAITKIGFLGSYFIFSVVPEATHPHQLTPLFFGSFLVQGYFH